MSMPPLKLFFLFLGVCELYGTHIVFTAQCPMTNADFIKVLIQGFPERSSFCSSTNYPFYVYGELRYPLAKMLGLTFPLRSSLFSGKFYLNGSIHRKRLALSESIC